MPPPSIEPVLALGDPLLDEQHAALLETLEALQHAARSGRLADEVGHTLGFLAGYVETHFAAEEALMLQRRYPALDAHRREHATFATRLRRLLSEYLAEGATPRVLGRVQLDAAAWIREHVHRADRAFGSFSFDEP